MKYLKSNLKYNNFSLRFFLFETYSVVNVRAWLAGFTTGSGQVALETLLWLAGLTRWQVQCSWIWPVIGWCILQGSSYLFDVISFPALVELTWGFREECFHRNEELSSSVWKGCSQDNKEPLDIYNCNKYWIFCPNFRSQTSSL